MNALTLLAQAAPDVGNVAGGVLGMFAIVWLIAIAGMIFWLWVLFDALAHEPTTEQKILWFLVIFFLPVIGAIAYLVVRKSSRGSPTAV